MVGNKFNRIPKAVNGIPQLLYLDLSKTSISEIRTEEIKDDHKLETLMLESLEFLYEIDDCAFCGFPDLRTLSLANATQLRSINPNAFGTSDIDDDSEETSHAPVLKEFNLQNCNLTTLPPELLAWDKVEKLYLSNNPLECSCDMAWLINDNTIHNFADSPTYV